MKTLTIEKTVYEFNELSDGAKQKALQDHAEHIDYEWYDSVYEDAKTIGALMGIDIDKIYFSGFSSQGDGACFESDYSYKKNSVNAVKEYAPKDTELHNIAQTLFNIQKRNFFQLTASINRRGFYYHELCTDIFVERDYQVVNDNAAGEIVLTLRDFMKWIYRQLENEYDYPTSEESFSELCQANEYNFYETGEMANL